MVRGANAFHIDEHGFFALSRVNDIGIVDKALDDVAHSLAPGGREYNEELELRGAAILNPWRRQLEMKEE